MKRIRLVLLLLFSPILSGCATEREYLFNNQPLWNAIEFIGGFFPSDPYAEIDYSADEPAVIRPL
jgi:hypothetical protein